MAMPLLRCDGLRKSFGQLVAVDDIGFEVASGEAYGLLGPNGAGKTTTIEMICGLLPPDAGEVEVAGRSLAADPAAAKARIGIVPQEIALYPDLTAQENLRFFGRLYGLRGQALRARVEAVLEVVGLADRATDRVDTYSGGMKRRVNIAAGLLHEPALVVLDEPTVGVDPQSRNAILESVAELSAQGTAILYTSHYMEEVERLCDRVGIMDRGRLIGEGTRGELVAELGALDRVELATDGDRARLTEACVRLDGVTEVIDTEHGVALLAPAGRERLPAVIGAAEEAGVALSAVEVVEPDLETVFLHLTGKALRD